MYLKHSLADKEETFKVIAWHEDTTQAGNYILTLETPLGRQIPAVERNDLTPDQIHELKTTAPKDSTGL